MDENFTKRAFLRKTSFRITQDDQDIISGVAKEYGISNAQALRVILRFAKLHRDKMRPDVNFTKPDVNFTKIVSIKNVAFRITQDDHDIITSVAKEYGIPNAQAVRVILKFTKLNRDKMGLDENTFILK